MIISYVLLAAASFAAGIINSVAGGGSFLVFPALLLTGLDARAANITSTLALYPMQVSTGFTGRKMAGGTPHLSFKALLILSLVGGVIGAVLLLMTPSTFFSKFVPWLLLFATAVFAWGSFRKKPIPANPQHIDRLGKAGAVLVQFIIGVYGGYFGGGIGLMMLATLTLAGMNIRQSATTKNILTAAINTSAVGVFFLAPDIHWFRIFVSAVTSVAGGLIGVRMLGNIDERWMRIGVVGIGVLLTAAMFIHAY